MTRFIRRSTQWLRARQDAVFLLVGLGLSIFLLFKDVVAAAAVTAAWVALMRHYAETKEDRQRRITESFCKAVEQLANDKVEVRLGGIYTLERISRESLTEYWTVLETLTAFVRERCRWHEVDEIRPDSATIAATTDVRPYKSRIPTDIAAVLSVLRRRDEAKRSQEGVNGWQLDLRGTNLRGADFWSVHFERIYLRAAHLEGATFGKAHLEGAYLAEAHLEGASLAKANLENAYLRDAHLEGASFEGANLKGAKLYRAHLERVSFAAANLEGASLGRAHLKGASLAGANLAGADLRDVSGLTANQLSEAKGDPRTLLPTGFARPAHWPSTAKNRLFG